MYRTRTKMRITFILTCKLWYLCTQYILHSCLDLKIEKNTFRKDWWLASSISTDNFSNYRLSQQVPNGENIKTGKIKFWTFGQKIIRQIEVIFFHDFFAISSHSEIFCPKLVGIDWNERIEQFSCYRFPFIGIENSAWHCVPKATRNLDRLVRRRELRLGSQFPRKSRMRWNLGEDLPGNKNSRNLWSWRVAATTRRERE